MENAKKFFEEVIKTEEAKKLFASYEKPATEEETLEIHSEVAAKLGIELTKDEIRAYFAENKISGEVDDEELSQLAGGKCNDCKDTYVDAENCWWEDGCDLILNIYRQYLCKNIDIGQ